MKLVFMSKSNPSLLFHKIGGFDTTLTLLKHCKISKVDQNSLPKQEFLRDFIDISKIGVCSFLKIFVVDFNMTRVLHNLVALLTEPKSSCTEESRACGCGHRQMASYCFRPQRRLAVLNFPQCDSHDGSWSLGSS